MALPAADLVLVNAACTADDIRAWCGAQGLGVPRTAVVPLGADGPVAPDTGEAAPLPAGLAAGRYALFVSTLEPRKNHRVLVAAWRRLIESGAPGIAGFRLVFVGRAGWGSGPLRDEIAADPRLAATIVHLAGVEDATVATLYRGAAFCCYPSRCEGYGLPVVEAFRFGKAVLASTGGALPEVVADFSPCLDPDDVDAWTAALRSWIADPAARAVHETRIRTAFRHPGWDAAAARFFACVHEATGSVAGSPGI
nr:glycosyltransferase family 1 protein [Rhodoplanes tepidamans]